MKAEQVASVLSSNRLFAELNHDAISAIASRAITRRHPRGDPIFYQGDPGGSLFIVAEGLVKVFIVSHDGEELVIATLRPPHSFGELSIIDEGPRPVSARALERTTLIALTRSTVINVMHTHPSVAFAVIQSLAFLLRRVLDQASDLVFLDLPGRLAKLLLTLAEERGLSEGDNWVLDIAVTQSTLAAMIGGSRPSVNQSLRSFENKGYIAIRGREVLIKRPDLLRKRAIP